MRQPRTNYVLGYAKGYSHGNIGKKARWHHGSTKVKANDMYAMGYVAGYAKAVADKTVESSKNA
jgi:hypothetical protein